MNGEEQKKAKWENLRNQTGQDRTIALGSTFAKGTFNRG